MKTLALIAAIAALIAFAGIFSDSDMKECQVHHSYETCAHAIMR